MSLWGDLHRDERGSISILSVFAALFLTMLLGMVMNVGRQVDGKIRLQNAADAAAYSGGLELARGMNALAFTNHLMCEMFAMTAILREASDPDRFPQYNGQQAARQVPEILDAWMNAAGLLDRAAFDKYQVLGGDLEVHLPQEQRLVTAFTQWAESFSADVLPVLEYALQELIPEYQRAVVEAYPDIAQAAAMEAARRNGEPDFGRGRMLAALWRTGGQLVGDPAYEPTDRTLPAVDPVLDMLPGQADYLDDAKDQRHQLAHHYLDGWNNLIFEGFDYIAPFSKFKELWAKITCGQLDNLLDEYPNANLPFQIRELDPPFDPAFPNGIPGMYNLQLEHNYAFVGVAYWKKVPQFAPRVFNMPMRNDSIAYAEVHLFQPARRLVWRHPTVGGVTGGRRSWFGNLSPDTPGESVSFWQIQRQESGYFPTRWSLLDQNWACQLAPALQSKLDPDRQNNLDVILQSKPSGVEFYDVNPPSLGNLKSEDIEKISPH